MAMRIPLELLLPKPSHNEQRTVTAGFSLPSRKIGYRGFHLAIGCSIIMQGFPRLMVQYSKPIPAAKRFDGETEEDETDRFSESDDDDSCPRLLPAKEREELRRKILETIDNAPKVKAEKDPEVVEKNIKKLVQDYNLIVEEEDPDWPEEDQEGWGFNFGQFFNKITIKNEWDEDEEYDSDKDIVWQDDNYIRPIKDITTAEWEDTTFKDFNPLVILVYHRYISLEENKKARARLTKAVRMFWESNLPSPRCVAVDAFMERDLVSALHVSRIPQIIFTKAGKILHRDKVIRTADELSKMMAFFYYKGPRPSCLDKSKDQREEKLPVL